jgi:hypothetical protein
LPTAKDVINVVVPEVPGVEITKDALAAINGILPYCGHRQEVSIYGLVYCYGNSVYTSNSYAFCKKEISGGGLNFELHGNCFKHLADGDKIAMATNDDNGVVYMQNDGFWGSVKNPIQTSYKDKLEEILSQAADFELVMKIDGSEFVTAAQMVSKLGCSYMDIGLGKIKGLDSYGKSVFEFDCEDQTKVTRINAEYVSRIASSCRGEDVEVFKGKKHTVLYMKTSEAEVMVQGIIDNF